MCWRKQIWVLLCSENLDVIYIRSFWSLPHAFAALILPQVVSLRSLSTVPFFSNHSPVLSLLLKKKKSSSRTKPSPPSPVCVHSWAQAVLWVGRRPGLQLSALWTASSDNTGLTSRDLPLWGCLPASTSIWSCPREPWHHLHNRNEAIWVWREEK